MKVTVSYNNYKFHYKLFLGKDDTKEGKRTFASVVNKNIQLVNTEYDLIVPSIFKSIHPDLHAAAILHILHPFISSHLDLSFSVSQTFADKIKKIFSITLTNIDVSLPPREIPVNLRSCLLFSGGMDSTAASLVVPQNTVHLFLDRLPHFDNNLPKDSLIELVEQKTICNLLQKNRKELYIICDDHEFLFEPYPTWHSEMSHLPALYLADTLNLNILFTGDVLDAIYLKGYHNEDLKCWKFNKHFIIKNKKQKKKEKVKNNPKNNYKEAENKETKGDNIYDLSHLGLRRESCIAGLSQVATAIIVYKSKYKGKTASCYYHSAHSHNFCLKCDKCFMKVLLGFIILNKEVPANLIDHFLSFPYLAAIFKKKYFDWHHIWFYVFQKIKCKHWFVKELQKQALKGPDLLLLEKWYPKAAENIPQPDKSIIEKNINKYVKTMNKQEILLLENIDVPPLYAPKLKDI